MLPKIFNIVRPPTKADRLRSAIAGRGVPHKRLAGGWLDDLAVLGKAIGLCTTCMRRWNPKKSGYAHKPFCRSPTNPQGLVVGECDGCSERNVMSFLLLPIDWKPAGF